MFLPSFIFLCHASSHPPVIRIRDDHCYTRLVGSVYVGLSICVMSHMYMCHVSLVSHMCVCDVSLVDWCVTHVYMSCVTGGLSICVMCHTCKYAMCHWWAEYMCDVSHMYICHVSLVGWVYVWCVTHVYMSCVTGGLSICVMCHTSCISYVCIIFNMRHIHSMRQFNVSYAVLYYRCALHVYYIHHLSYSSYG